MKIAFADKELFSWSERVSDDLVWNPFVLNDAVSDYISYFLWFLYLIAVLYIIYAWFKILIAWEDQEKVNSSKSTILAVLWWILVIFAADSIVKWLFEKIIEK